jgi:hypothetical protein
LLRKLSRLMAAFRNDGRGDARDHGSDLGARISLRVAARALAVLVVVAILAWISVRMLRRPPAGGRVLSRQQAQIVRLYGDLERALAQRGHPRPPALTPLEHSQQLTQSGFAQRAEVEAVTLGYLEARYGGRPLRNAEIAELRKAIERVRDAA